MDAKFYVDGRIDQFSDSTGPHRRSLRIAQIAPLYESVPPKLYGGTERVVAYLCEALAQLGHEVTLFASGDSQINVRLRPGHPVALRLAGLSHGPDHLGPALHLPMLGELYAQADSFDLIHSHVDVWAFPLARIGGVPTLSTLHGRLDSPAFRPVYDAFADLPFISISNAQRQPLPHLNWCGTVHHGLPTDLLRLGPGAGGYLAFIGRMSPEKGLDRAIEVACRAGIRLRIAAKVDEADRGYFSERIAPLLGRPGIEFIGEIDDRQKQDFLGNAIGLLFPIDWPEPFGLAMIEALACGTPIVARPCGSVPEVVEPGVTGLIACSMEDLTGAVRRLPTLSRRACRSEFERRFSNMVMARNYERVYRSLISSRNLIDGRRADRLSDGAADPATRNAEEALYQAK